MLLLIRLHCTVLCMYCVVYYIHAPDCRVCGLNIYRRSVRVINSFCHVASKGNCRGGNVEMPDENVEPLTKRCCSRSKVHHVVTK